MKKIVSLFIMIALVAVAVFTFGPSPTSSSLVNPQEAQAATTCYNLWQHSGHTAYVKWYHCHWQTSNRARVHICSGRTATLHGITVEYSSPIYIVYESGHAHDLYGEGCFYF